ncbi:MAG: hypothetical protein WC969_12705 [Elusimicrobiota bacterium]|jgi:hypothetical protein
MSWTLPLILWLSAAATLRRCWRLRLDEAAMGGGLVASFEVVVLITALGRAGKLQPLLTLCITAVLALFHVALALEGRGPVKHRAARITVPVLVWAALVPAVLVLAFRIHLASSLPLDSWDALSYHAPIVLRWLQQGNLDLAGFSGYTRYYPWNGELFSAWLALLDGSSLDPARTAQLYPLLWMACAGLVIGRRLGGRRWAAAVGAALLALPIAVLQTGVPYVDVFYASFWVCAAASALCWDRCGRGFYLVLWGAAFGLTMGTKASLYYHAPLVLQLLVTLLSRPQRRKSFVLALPFAAAAVLIGGAYCYARNILHHGNPIYPFTFRLAGYDLFTGIMSPKEFLTRDSWFVESGAGWFAYPFRETFNRIALYSNENGFGPVCAAGLLLFPWAAARALRRRDWGAVGFLALVPGSIFFFFTLNPGHEPRYLTFLAAGAIGGLAYLLSGLRGVRRQLALGAWTFGVAWGLLGVVGGVFQEPGVLEGWQTLRAGGRVDAFEYYRVGYNSLADAWAALNPRLKKDDVVAFNYGELELPLAGLPPLARPRQITHGDSMWPDAFAAATDDEWLELLNALNARFFVLWSPAWAPENGKAEARAIARFPGRFRNIGHWRGNMGTVDLYEVLPAAAGGTPPAKGFS